MGQTTIRPRATGREWRPPLCFPGGLHSGLDHLSIEWWGSAGRSASSSSCRLPSRICANGLVHRDSRRVELPSPLHQSRRLVFRSCCSPYISQANSECPENLQSLTWTIVRTGRNAVKRAISEVSFASRRGTGIRRHPTSPRASSGSAWAKLPPVVPWFRTIRSPIAPAASGIIGHALSSSVR